MVFHHPILKNILVKSGSIFPKDPGWKIPKNDLKFPLSPEIQHNLVPLLQKCMGIESHVFQSRYLRYLRQSHKIPPNTQPTSGSSSTSSTDGRSSSTYLRKVRRCKKSKMGHWAAAYKTTPKESSKKAQEWWWFAGGCFCFKKGRGGWFGEEGWI